MGVKFFGQYLLEKNIIKPHELMKAVEYQEQRYTDFGDCAIEKGYITKEELVKLKRKQKEVDMRFGEIAIKLHILTPEQVNEILETQKSDNIYIGEALAKNGFLTMDEIDRELALFREDQHEYSTKDELIPEGVKNPEIVKEIVVLTEKLFNRVVRLKAKIGNGLISYNEPGESFLIVSIALNGDHQCEYCLSLPGKLAKIVTTAIIGDTINDDETELIIDGVKEFCNIVCGNIIAKLSHKGKIIEIGTPEVIAIKNGVYNMVIGRRAIYYPLTTTEGDGTLLLIESD